MENDWIERTQDVRYDLVLKSGANLGAQRYAKQSFLHNSRSRWRKTFWDGAQPGDINIDFNLPYMISTEMISSFDTSLKLSSLTVAGEVSAFNATDKCDLGGKGQLQNYFSAPGGRPDLGIFPRWVTRWLYTMDFGLYGVMMSNAECSAFSDSHFRESNASYFYDSAQQISGYGHEININGRPQYSTLSIGLGEGDRPYRVANATGGIWGIDVAHQPNFAYLPYLITGDFFFGSRSSCSGVRSIRCMTITPTAPDC